MDKRYQWESPFDWLMYKAGSWSTTELYNALRDIAVEAGSDALHEVFQSEMEADGYFDAEVEDNG